MKLQNVRLNVLKINSFSDFCNIRGGTNGNVRDIFFVRQLGNNAPFLKELQKNEMDMKLKKNNDFYYLRIKELPIMRDYACIEYYTECYKYIMEEKYDLVKLKNNFCNWCMCTYGKNAFEQLRTIFYQINRNKNPNESIEKNFLTKILYWFDWTAEKEAIGNFGRNNKIVFENIIKTHEYLFTYFLCLMGFDVCLLQTREDIEDRLSALQLSQMYTIDKMSKEVLYNFTNGAAIERQEGDRKCEVKKDEKIIQNRIKIPKHPNREQQAKIEEDKSFEEIAKLASSVVMIEVHSSNDGIIGYGSGIMIGEQGYILTNCHVIVKGDFFTIRLEDDENVYETNEVIKYHSNLDLALIRISKKLNPLKIYNQKQELVRGQKVVAIGSPLGLFNSVSDGIISGFRDIDGINMMQFTAPISNGSSGGAVLDMKGRVIGISTAGIDIGQNINLAIKYDDILAFLKGFV